MHYAMVFAALAIVRWSTIDMFNITSSMELVNPISFLNSCNIRSVRTLPHYSTSPNDTRTSIAGM